MNKTLEKLMLNTGKVGILQTQTQTMEVRIEEVNTEQNTLRYFTTEGLKKLNTELAKPFNERDALLIYDIQQDNNYFASISLDEVIDFTPLDSN